MAKSSRPVGNSIDQTIDTNLGSTWLWGIVATCLFYAFVPYSPIYSGEIQRYFTAQWIEFAITGLFFVGACSLYQKWKQFPVERNAVQAGLLNGVFSDSSDDAAESATKIEAHLALSATHLKDTLLLKRVRAACQYIVCRQSADGLEGHLKDLADRDSKRLEESEALFRTITWSIPILGILGTIIGIADAVAKITPATLDASLAALTMAVSVAFDTSVVALALLVVLVIGKLIVAHPKSQLLNEVDDFAITKLLGLFPKGNVDPASPLRIAEKQAADQLLISSEKMIHGQLSLWQASLESLRECWSNTLSHQQDALVQALQTGLTNALTDHSQQLVQSRSEFMTAFLKASESIGTQLAETRSSLAEQQQHGSEQILQTWQQFRVEITKTRDEHARQLALLTQAITAEVGGWQNQLESSTQSMSHQFQELRSQGEVFLKIAENESELVRLESRLAENLEAVRVVDSLEFTLMNLNAAVNLLTSRVKSNAA